MTEHLRLELAGLRSWAVSIEQAAEAFAALPEMLPVSIELVGHAGLAARLHARLTGFDAHRGVLARRLARLASACRVTADRFESRDRDLARGGVADRGGE